MTVLATRTPVISASVGSTALTNVLSARCSFGFDMQVAEATIYVATNPVPGTALYNQAISLALAYSGHPARFVGLFRGYDYTLYPRMVGLVCRGQLVRADDYQNNEDNGFGGIELYELLGAESATDQAAVKAALTKAGVSFVDANIGGTGVTFGEKVIGHVTPFRWSNGVSWNPSFTTESTGETALSYIQRWDAAGAVYTSDTAPAGRYRTFESLGGVVYRALIGGRPRGTVDFTFTEGEDIEQGTSQRQYPAGNRVFVQGYDMGLGQGPVSNLESDSIQGSNPYMPDTEKHTITFSSPMIERPLALSGYDVWSAEDPYSPGDAVSVGEEGYQCILANTGQSPPNATYWTDLGTDTLSGMSCETVAGALMLDVNREIVLCDFTTPRDDWIGPGATVQVQAPGGTVDRLGIGENLWVSHVDVEIDAQGKFSQRHQCIGGGLPSLPTDDYTPAPPDGS